MKQPMHGIRGVRLVRGDKTAPDIVDVLIDEGKINKIGKGLLSADDASVIDGTGKYLLHGFYDIGCRLGYPDGSFTESADSAFSAARSGGFCGILAYPSRADVFSSSGAGVSFRTILSAACREDVGQGRGKVYAEAAPAGAVPMSLAERYRLFCAVAETDSILLVRPFDDSFADGAIREGIVARMLHLDGIPEAAETAALARDIALSAETGAKIHFMGISSSASVELIREAKQKGVPISVGVSPCHLAMTVDDIPYHGVNAKVLPPLGTDADRQAIRRGLHDGTIDCLHSFHQPMRNADKGRDIKTAPFGASTLDIAAKVAMTYLTGEWDDVMTTIARCMAARPAELIGERGLVETGTPLEELILISPYHETIVSSGLLRSRGMNCPFIGLSLRGNIE